MKHAFVKVGAKVVSIAALLALTTLLFAPPARALFEFTVEDEAELGHKFNILVRSRMPLVLDPEVVQYVEGIVKRLQAGVKYTPFPFTVGVVRSGTVNAFATPGGYVFVYTGLILAMENEAQLAGVLGHEMAHVTQRHVAGQVEASKKVTILGLLGMLAGAFLGGDAGQAAMVGAVAAGQTAMLNYSRADEADADKVGLSYVVRAGYPPQGLPDAFKILRQKQWASGSDIPSYLSTHPALQERVGELQAVINTLPPQTRNLKGDNTEFYRIQTLIRARYAEPESAMKVFEKQLKTQERCDALMGMGILNSRQNKVMEAGKYFEEALVCNPKSPLILREAGWFNYNKGDAAKAETYLNKALSINPHDYMAMFFSARILADAGKYDQAMAHYREILTRFPEDSEVHTYYAQALGRSNRLFEAHLELAYSALYENNEKKVKQYMEKAKQYAKNDEEKRFFARFEKEYKERKEFWR